MPRFAIAMDLGTSSFRAQAIDLSSFEIISTVVTNRHPLPGSNVIDHLHFALEIGLHAANGIMIQAANKIIKEIQIPAGSVHRLALCGNPIQLSLFQGIEIRDLAYAGKHKLESLNITPPNRESIIVAARDIPGLDLPWECEVIIPPAICHEVGADTLAMIMLTGMLEKEETSLAIDYGTNAEMALFHNGTVITASAAAGPTLEGQHITCGMLAAPGAISDLNQDISCHRLFVLNSEMFPVPGSQVSLKNGIARIDEEAPLPIGITGTGTVALLHQAMAANLIELPRILTVDGRLHLGRNLYFTESDLIEAGKAIGALRAGYSSLCQQAGIALEDICTTYMCGASGTYVDAVKSQQIGMIPPRVKTVYQMGNTSLAMARDLVKDCKILDAMNELAWKLKTTHFMFASSETFQKTYILEMAYWTEGMPMLQYRKFLRRYGFPDLPPVEHSPLIIRTVTRDIDDFGRMGLKTIANIGQITQQNMPACDLCLQCVMECPENALSIVAQTEPPVFALDQSICLGVGCRRCERVCSTKTFKLNHFFQT